MAEQTEIRGLMIPVTNGRVLLPNASVAEVITLSVPEKIPNAPEWLMGRINWRGWRLPLFSFSLLAGMALEEGSRGTRVTVLKALSGHAKMPFLAMLAQGFPRLTTLSPDILVPSNESMPTRPGVLMNIIVRDDQAVIPDLGQIEQLIADSLAAA
ncbi:MAG: chemotaxis protein CheW [Rhodanobacteraceae bacterium]|nr:chemotaxis protein CheW [Rhodanobacteraceae bacterium]